MEAEAAMGDGGAVDVAAYCEEDAALPIADPVHKNALTKSLSPSEVATGGQFDEPIFPSTYTILNRKRRTEEKGGRGVRKGGSLLRKGGKGGRKRGYVPLLRGCVPAVAARQLAVSTSIHFTLIVLKCSNVTSAARPDCR
jgi:hypothetical protein